MKNTKHNNYIIYKAQNKLTSNVYIGATKSSIESRKRDHTRPLGDGELSKFQKAIATYGTDAFFWEQIDTAKSTDELAKKEKRYILQYNSKEDGLNSDCGGGIRKSIFRYDLEGQFVDKFDCLKSAGNAVNANKKLISKVCLSKIKKCKGFYWTYDYVDSFIPQDDLRVKKVCQYTLNNDFLNEFSSVSEASNKTGCNKSGISKVCRFERVSSGGYIWRYK